MVHRLVNMDKQRGVLRIRLMVRRLIKTLFYENLCVYKMLV